MNNYESRLIVPINGNQTLPLYSSSKSLLITGYERIVIGGRGPYVEFTPQQMVSKNFMIVDEWRLTNPNCYYVEYRTKDPSYVKLYHQKKTVNYADYKIGMCYISPFDLHLEDGTVLIEKPDRE